MAKGMGKMMDKTNDGGDRKENQSLSSKDDDRDHGYD